MFQFLAPFLAAFGGGGAAAATGAAAAAGGATFGSALAAAAPDLLGAAVSAMGASKARKQAIGDAANKFVDLRAAAEKGGFSPLTALQATGGAGFGNYGSSAPPLASVELLTGAVGKFYDEASGQGAQRRATDKLNFDLAQLRLDQARSGVYVPSPPSAVAGMGPSPLGNSVVTVQNGAWHASGKGGKDAVNSPADLAALRAAGANGFELGLAPIDLFVPYRLRDGSIVFGPNPNGMDMEQMAAAGLLATTGEVKQGLGLRDEPSWFSRFGAWLNPFSDDPVASGPKGSGRPRPRPRPETGPLPLDWWKTQTP